MPQLSIILLNEMVIVILLILITLDSFVILDECAFFDSSSVVNTLF